jgi:hypothetical protein
LVFLSVRLLPCIHQVALGFSSFLPFAPSYRLVLFPTVCPTAARACVSLTSCSCALTTHADPFFPFLFSLSLSPFDSTETLFAEIKDKLIPVRNIFIEGTAFFGFVSFVQRLTTVNDTHLGRRLLLLLFVRIRLLLGCKTSIGKRFTSMIFLT